MSNSGVQLHGKEKVLMAYRNITEGVDEYPWAIFAARKNLMHKGIGEETLDAFLTMLAEEATAAIYTIKFYEDLAEPRQVKEKTEASGSLNFRLEMEDYKSAGANNNSYIRKLEERIGLLESGIEPDEPQTFESAVMGLISKPTELVELLTSIKALMAPSTAAMQGQPYTPPAALGNIMKTSKNYSTMSDEEKIARMQAAVTVLDQYDPNLCEHLEALAAAAKEDPNKFTAKLNMLLAMFQ